jgi:hypothetical protein
MYRLKTRKFRCSLWFCFWVCWFWSIEVWHVSVLCLQEIIAAVLARPDLLITRNVEWANLAFGFEQVGLKYSFL